MLTNISNAMGLTCQHLLFAEPKHIQLPRVAVAAMLRSHNLTPGTPVLLTTLFVHVRPHATTPGNNCRPMQPMLALSQCCACMYVTCWRF
jgi:hypothetical protein